MALPNTTQEDYQILRDTTGKGFKQSIFKKQYRTNPIGHSGTFTFTPFSTGGFICDGSIFLCQQQGLYEISASCSVSYPTVGYQYYILSTLGGRPFQIYSDGVVGVNQEVIKVTRDLKVNDSFYFYSAHQGGSTNNVTITDFTISLY
jgi:hypothetical protein